MSTPAKKKCFVIMPISTPELALERYGNDPSHFPHIFEHLFKPALEALDIEAIPPSTMGAEIIHGEIIRNIESADLTLCDISTLNANVFFELGIRTAINKSVIIVRDSHTAKVPFDTAIINTYTYEPDLRPWVLKTQVDALKTHISNCLAKGDKGNAMWKYFSLSMTAKPLEAATGMEGKIEALTLQINALRRAVETTQTDPFAPPFFTAQNQNPFAPTSTSDPFAPASPQDPFAPPQPQDPVAPKKKQTYTLLIRGLHDESTLKELKNNIPGITHYAYSRLGQSGRLTIKGEQGLARHINNFLLNIGITVSEIRIS